MAHVRASQDCKGGERTPKHIPNAQHHVKYAFLERVHMFYPSRSIIMNMKGADYDMQIQSELERVKSPGSMPLLCLLKPLIEKEKNLT